MRFTGWLRLLFLVITTPHPQKPEEVANARLEFLKWMDTLQKDRVVLNFYPRVGRGAIAIFDVTSNDQLHELLTRWTSFVSVEFEIYPLASVESTKRLLEKAAKR